MGILILAKKKNRAEQFRLLGSGRGGEIKKLIMLDKKNVNLLPFVLWKIY